MKAELDASPVYEKNQKGNLQTSNKRNGHTPKTLQSQYGEFQIDIPGNRYQALNQLIVLYGERLTQYL